MKIISTEDNLLKFDNGWYIECYHCQNCCEWNYADMDKDLVEAARKLSAENIFDLVMKNYCETNRDYLEKQIKIAAEYLTDSQKKELAKIGVMV